MASRAGRQGSMSPDLKQLISDAPQTGGKGKSIPSGHGEEGCKVCGRDEDHANLLLCEACNEEYHTYCLDPPLECVPDDDWFCDSCKKLHSIKDDDGLDSLVSALPPSYTSRFGEIVWAAGGNGFGWWPACIYDPRLTVGGARQLARKNLGKRHLIYFFECYDAPFTVLADSRLCKWQDGFIEEYDLGKTAKSGNKSKAALFDKALSVAQLENERPIEMRMDWNHQDPPVLKSKTKAAAAAAAAAAASAITSSRIGQPATTVAAAVAPPKKKQKVPSPISVDSVNRKHVKNISEHSLIEPSEDGPLLCKILRRLPIGGGGVNNPTGVEFSTNIGFVTLPSRQNATFADIRRVVEKELDEDCFPGSEGREDGKRIGARWKFYVPKLGPVSVKQEKSLGPVLEFLKTVSNDGLLGNGTSSSPLKIVFVDV
eukprot:scaffold5102_cov76-Cyclotella_meneghiniana.AAC.12